MVPHPKVEPRRRNRRQSRKDTQPRRDLLRASLEAPRDGTAGGGVNRESDDRRTRLCESRRGGVGGELSCGGGTEVLSAPTASGTVLLSVGRPTESEERLEIRRVTVRLPVGSSRSIVVVVESGRETAHVVRVGGGGGLSSYEGTGGRVSSLYGEGEVRVELGSATGGGRGGEVFFAGRGGGETALVLFRS